MGSPIEPSKLTRRSVLISAAGSASLVAGMTRWAEAEAKVPQSAVHYQTMPRDGQDCGHCYQFVAPHSCKFVDGDIAPTGWCGLWVHKTA